MDNFIAPPTPAKYPKATTAEIYAALDTPQGLHLRYTVTCDADGNPVRDAGEQGYAYVIAGWDGREPTPAALEKLLTNGKAKLAGRFYYCMDCQPEYALHYEWLEKLPGVCVTERGTGRTVGRVCETHRFAREKGPADFSAPPQRSRIAPEVA
jgi:hypothetical protein